MMAGANLFLNEHDSGLILYVVDAGGSVRRMTSGLKRYSASEEQNHHTPPPGRSAPSPRRKSSGTM
jgi:hypothetical protein